MQTHKIRVPRNTNKTQLQNGSVFVYSGNEGGTDGIIVTEQTELIAVLQIRGMMFASL